MNQPKALKWQDYIPLYGIPTLLNYIACKFAIPYLKTNTLLPSEIIYFISVGGLVLIPMFLLAIYLTRKEIGSNKWDDLFKRMRINRMEKKDWVWAIASFILLCIASFLIARVLMPGLGFDPTPFFFENMPLDSSHMWILYIWPLFFFFNIFGEEFLWRGYIQPRQELLHKKWTWFFHGLFWALWHLPMGLELIFAALPIFFILPAIVQLRKNTTIAIVIHAIFGVFGFLVISFGGVH